METVIYHGICHCGAVRFRIESTERVECGACDCSICSKTGYLHLLVPKSNFTLLSGEKYLSTTTFNGEPSRHRFCTSCGITTFYIPRANPEFYDVNVRCLEPQPIRLIVSPFVGGHCDIAVIRPALASG